MEVKGLKHKDIIKIWGQNFKRNADSANPIAYIGNKPCDAVNNVDISSSTHTLECTVPFHRGLELFVRVDSI
jgi:hypothetical protein